MNENEDYKSNSSNNPQNGNKNLICYLIKDDSPIKKNRQLQFYSFIFYSNKLEIQLNEFLSETRLSNILEIALWIFSIICYFNIPSNFPQVVENGKKVKYKSTFIWIHILHIIKGVLGLFIWKKVPRTFQITDYINCLGQDELKTHILNDIIRETFKEQIFKKIEKFKLFFSLHLLLIFINYVIDLCDFIIILLNIDKASSDSKVVLLTYLFIGLLYLKCDLSYILYGYCLKYFFPKKYLVPIQHAFDGFVSNIMTKLKLNKPKTDVIQEYINQNKLPDLNNKNNNIEDNLPNLNDKISYEKNNNHNLENK